MTYGVVGEVLLEVGRHLEDRVVALVGGGGIRSARLEGNGR